MRVPGVIAIRLNGEPGGITAKPAAPDIPQRAALYLAVVQFFFATTWTIYAIYLPALAQTVGIPRAVVPWILVLDDIVFTVTDFAMGVAADRVIRLVGRVGPAIVAATAVSCLCFLAIPNLARFGEGAAGLVTIPFIASLGIWAVTSSALRAPPWVMISRYAATPRLPWLCALSLFGTALGGAVSPYLGITLRDLDPRLPFLLSSATLFATTAGLLWVERSLAPGRIMESEPPPAARSISIAPALPVRLALFFGAAGLLSLGFQALSGFSAAPQFLRFAPSSALPYLIPIFWVGFYLLSLPAAAATRRWGALRVLAGAALLGALGGAMAAGAPNLVQTIVGQALAGGAWGAVLTAGLSTAIVLGRSGREGSMTGLWFSTQSAAAALRIAVVAAQLDSLPEVATLILWATPLLWLAATLVLLGLGRTGLSRARPTLA